MKEIPLFQDGVVVKKNKLRKPQVNIWSSVELSAQCIPSSLYEEIRNHVATKCVASKD